MGAYELRQGTMYKTGNIYKESRSLMGRQRGSGRKKVSRSKRSDGELFVCTDKHRKWQRDYYNRNADKQKAYRDKKLKELKKDPIMYEIYKEKRNEVLKQWRAKRILMELEQLRNRKRAA